MRASINASNESAVAHSKVAAVNPDMLPTMTRRTPKRAASHPVMGVTIAVARMLKVMDQAISSDVAENDPCICGRMVDTTSRVVLYSVVARITDARTVIWRKVSRTGASSEVVRISVFTQVFTAGSGGATRMKSTSGATAIVASSTSA